MHSCREPGTNKSTDDTELRTLAEMTKASSIAAKSYRRCANCSCATNSLLQYNDGLRPGLQFFPVANGRAIRISVPHAARFSVLTSVQPRLKQLRILGYQGLGETIETDGLRQTHEIGSCRAADRLSVTPSRRAHSVRTQCHRRSRETAQVINKPGFAARR